ncbi:hypothetical protein D3C83_119130 [compost metagenome]
MSCSIACAQGLWILKKGSFFRASLARLTSTSLSGCVGSLYSTMSLGVTPRNEACGTQKKRLMCAALPEPTLSVR